MKKVLSLVLVLAMVLGMMPVFAAGETGADQLYKYGFIAGNNGDLMVNKELTRAEMAVIMAEMNGLKEEAANYAAPANFSDVEAGKWYTPYVAYGQANGWWAGYPDGTFKPEIGMSGQEFASVLMNALKYDVNFNTVIADAAAVGVSVKSTTSLTRGDAFDSMWVAVNTPAKGETVALGVKLGRLESAMINENGPLAVKTIKAASAKTFTVEFNKAVTDADKITFSVKRMNSEITVTTAWNEAKTQATLASASNLPESIFDVVVLADAKEVAKETISITPQKVSKIEFTSDSVAVQLTDPQNGFVTYKAYDQYGNDITDSYLANNMTFTTGAGDATAKNGLVTIKKNSTPLLQFPNISIIAYDTTSNASATVTLPTASAIGTLKSFTLGSTEGLSLVEGDITSTFYLPYTALDMSGNETKNIDLVKGGLIDSDSSTSDIDLSVSLSNYVSAKVVTDPNNSNHAAIEVKVKNNVGGSELYADMNVSITAMTYSNGTSNVTATLSKSKSINAITLLSPAETVAVGERPEIKFEAYDQYGNKITKYSDMDGNKLNLTNLELIENTDGSAKLKVKTALVKGTTTLTAAVSGTNKMSQITLNVQDAQIPAKLVLNNADVIYAMEVGATQNIIFDEGEAVKVYDQYDREMDSDQINDLFKSGADYKVNVSVTGGVISTSNFDKDDVATPGVDRAGDYTKLKAGSSEGSATVAFELVQKALDSDKKVYWKSLSTVQMSMAVVKSADITDYTINAVDKAIYTSIARKTDGTAEAKRDVDSRYDAEIKVYGKTNGGAKVLLANYPINSGYVSNEEDFVVNTSTGAMKYNAVRVNAIKPADNAKTGAETTLTVSVLHNSKVTPLTTTIKSSTVKPVASKITTSSTSNDADSATRIQLDGKYLVNYTETGLEVSTDNANKASFTFSITDQYGSKAMPFASFIVAKATIDESVTGHATTASVSDIKVNKDGKITINAASTKGNSYWITASTANGLKSTIKLTITD